MTLKSDMAEIIASGLKRKTLTCCSKWAENCVIMGTPFPGPLRFKHHPWLKEMHDSNAEKNVGQKSAQMGYTVACMNRAFYKIDIERLSVLYLLPTKTPDATDFSATRFDPLLELSPHLNNLFSDVKNVATKRAGSATLYIRGANSRSGLKSIPVACIIFDEFDEMPKDNISLALERTSGQLSKQVWMISTPTVPGMGINEQFISSTMEHFFFPCPSCSKLTELIYPDSLIICGDSITDPDLELSHIICKECKAPLKHEAKPEFLNKGQWQPTGHNDFNNRGFYINQMYSPTIHPKHLAVSYILSKTNMSDEQEFYNSKLGLPHIVDGGRVDDELIKRSLGDYKKSSAIPEGAFTTMGVDVGKVLHIEIAQWIIDKFANDINVRAHCKVLWEGTYQPFEELDKLMYKYQIRHCVIDANPEGRKALEFAKRFPGHVSLCYYGKNISNKSVQRNTTTKDYKVTVDRTCWLDLSLGRFHNGSITLPIDTSFEYKKQIKEPIRRYEKDADGNPVGRYVNKDDDHFAHARNYCEIALPLAASAFTNSDIERFL